MEHAYAKYRDTPLWRTVASAINQLQRNGEIEVKTAPDYVIGYLCQQLEVRKIATVSALEFDPQR